MFYPFIGTYDRRPRRVEADITVLTKWEERKMSTQEAARRIANNNCARILSDEEFTRLANQLGYFREG